RLSAMPAATAGRLRLQWMWSWPESGRMGGRGAATISPLFPPNDPAGGAFRGYGMPQGTLGLECALDELCTRIGVDPWDLRMANALDGAGRTATGESFDEPFAFKKVLETIHPDWRRLQTERDVARAQSAPDERVGVGLAAGWYQFGKGG